MLDRSGWFSRALVGFGVGVAVCLLYWSLGFVPREIWLSSPIAHALVQAKGWVWPTALLDVLFRDLAAIFAVTVLYSLNGITYAVVSGALAALRARPGLYVLFMVAVIALLAWYNIAVLQAFSWLGFGAVLLGMGGLAVFDLRHSSTRVKAGQG